MNRRKRIRITESQEMAINQYLIRENDELNRRHNEFIQSETLTAEEVEKIRQAVSQILGYDLQNDSAFNPSAGGHKMILPTRITEKMYPDGASKLEQLLPDFDVYYDDDRRTITIYRKGYFDRKQQMETPANTQDSIGM